MKLPKYVESLCVFGEVGIITIGSNKIRAKLDDCGILGLFTGYPENYSRDSFCMLNLNTKCFWTTRDIIWMNKMYGDFKSLTPQQITFIDDVSDFDEMFEQEEENNDHEHDVEIEEVDDEEEEEAHQQPQCLTREL